MIRFSQLDRGEFCCDVKTGDRILKTSARSGINMTRGGKYEANNQFVFRLTHYICCNCQHETAYAAKDYEFHKDHLWVCPECFVVIAEKQYPLNVEGKILVSPMGESLGDRIVQEVIKRQLQVQNPDSDIIFWKDGIITNHDIGNIQPRLVFWANLYNGGLEYMPRKSIWFSLTNEANAFQKQSIYPEWQRIDDIHGFDRMQNYVLLSMRNVDKIEEKNVEAENIFSILVLLKKFVEANKIEKIILVGNDKDKGGLSLERFEYILGMKLPITDYRGRLSLEQIAGLAANAILVMGKDNGIIHLAGAAISAKSPNWETFRRIPQGMVVWGYQTWRWFPKVANGKCDTFEQKDNNINDILKCVEKRLCWK